MPIHLPSSIPIRIPFVSERSFNFIKPIRITNRTTKLTDYQIEVNLNTSNFAFEKARSDGADIRFQDANGKALSYWIESWSSTSAKIWVKLDELGDYEERFVYMIYGNCNCLSGNDGANTFMKFNAGTTSGWNTITANWIEEGGALKNTGTTYQTARMNIGINDYIAECIVKTPAKTSYQYLGIAARRVDQDADSADTIFASIGGNTGEYSMWKGNGWLNSGAYANIQLNTWYAIKMVLDGANVDFYSDPEQTSATTLRLSTSIASVVTGPTTGWVSSVIANHFYDNLRIRAYSSLEPIVEIL